MIQHPSTLLGVFDDYGLQIVGLLLAWATVLLGAAWLIAGLLRRASASVRYCVWQYALLGLLAAPGAFALLPGIPLGLTLARARPELSDRPALHATGQLRQLNSPMFDSAAGRRSFGTAPSTDLTRMPVLVNDPAAMRNRGDGSSKVGVPEGGPNAAKVPVANGRTATARGFWSMGLASIWGLGVIVQLAWIAWCVGRARRMLRAAEPVDELRISQIQRELECRLSISRSVRLLKSAAASSPLLAGVRRPSILLPADCVDWPAEKLRIVLSHELAHVERRDIFWQLAARTATALYWFHPLAWLALNRMRQEREQACDDRVLSVGVSAIDYAAGLAEFAAALAGRPSPLAGSLGMAEQLPLEDRVRSILDSSQVRHPASARVRGMLLVATACLVLLMCILRPFAPKPTAAADAPKAENKPAVADKQEAEKQPPATDKAKAESKPAATPAAKPAPKRNAEPALQEPKQLSTKGSMLVRVVGPDGKPIKGAKLFANVSSWNRKAAQWDKHWVIKNDDYVTGPDGSASIKLPPLVEDVRLWARKEGYAPMFAIWWPKEQPELTEFPEEFTYRLQKGTIVGGLVKNEDGEPIAGVKVEVSYESNRHVFAPTHAVFDTWLAEDDGAVVTDADGRWKLTNVPPGNAGELFVKLSHPDYIDDANWGGLQKQQHVTLKELHAQTAVIVMRRGTNVTGTVSDPDDQPIKDAVVIWGDRPYREEGSQEVRTNEQGEYQLPPLPTGPKRLTVVAQGWMPEQTEVQILPDGVLSDSQRVNFRLRRGKKLRLRFIDQSGATVSRVRVSVSKWREAEALYNTRHPNVLDTGIPRISNANGIYEWDWAPDSPVEFQFSRAGFAESSASITADDSEHVIALLPQLRLAGTVVDADTGRPIDEFSAVPTIHFRENFPNIMHDRAVPFTGGKFSLEFDRTDVEHSLQIEAPGYATVHTRRYAIGDSVPPLEIRMKPAERFVGRVVNESGRPVANARVYVGSFSEHLYLTDLDEGNGGRSSNYRVKTNEQGEFEIAHQLERYALTVVSDEGYGEADRPAGELPGVVKVRSWAKLSGRLVQNGKPVGDWNVQLTPIRDHGGNAPRGHVSFNVKTAEDGSFSFDRVPPVPCRVQGDLHWSIKGPLSSSRSVPVAPAPGEEVVVTLGAGGAEVTGKLALDPPAALFDYHFGLNYLVARRPGIAPPAAIAEKGFDWRHGWSDAWTNTQEGGAYLQTLHHYFVKPDPDGHFRISGVEPGEYDLSLALYGSTEGCLVHPAGMAVVRVTVADGQSALDLGTIKVPAIAGLKAGDAAPKFEFTRLDGKRRKLAELRGKYVLVEFWATWCGPCVEKIAEVESLRQKYANRPGLVVIGANLDQDIDRAKEFIRQKQLPWEHALLGDWSATDIPKRFAVSSTPAYVLVAPDGRIAAHETSLSAIEAVLDQAAHGGSNR